VEESGRAAAPGVHAAAGGCSSAATGGETESSTRVDRRVSIGIHRGPPSTSHEIENGRAGPTNKGGV
jgi:hypothetical protein